MLTKLYNRLLLWAAHPKATWYLGMVAFIESSVFPLPPDVLLVPMCLSKPTKSWYYATITTVWSVIGGFFGYLLGFFIFEWIEYAIHWAGYHEAYAQVVEWFHAYGFWVVFLSGITPIPYKLFTIGAGMVQMPLLAFGLASICGRGARFFLVAAVARYTHQTIDRWMKQYAGRIMCAVLVLVLGAWVLLR